ncbi:MAG: hypothetical protein JSV62_14215 [Promethearchaeota archaeon]|nr:MAG: hypothetical protein JSV62_14215 [Candidatus Lokiarchaeota archaeon]
MTKNKQNESSYSFQSFIKNEIIKKGNKLGGKFSPISEVIDNVSKSLSVEKIIDLKEENKNFFFLIVRNYAKKPKFRYFLVISIANNSSDLLVDLARDTAIKNDLKLIQYSIFPKTLRIQLLLLKEIQKIEDYTNYLEKLSNIRKDYRIKLAKIKDLIENK